MNIKERIEKIGEYFSSLNVASEDNVIYVRVKFPKGWACSELTEYNFNVKAVNDEVPGYFYFFTEMEVGFDKLFDAIEFNINFNKEAEIKVSLLKTKIEELKTIFEIEEIDVLKTLEFKYKKKQNKKVKNKIKENNIENNTITSEIIDNSKGEFITNEDKTI